MPSTRDGRTRDGRRGLLFGTLGMLGFSLTFPMTRVAVQELPPVFVGLGRALIGFVLGGTLLWVRRTPRPAARHVRGLLALAVGVVIGYALLTSLALHHVPAAHGAIVIGMIPLSTAGFGTWLARERLPLGFWVAAIVGSSAVVIFFLGESGWVVCPEDGLLVLAAILCGFGYAEGGRVSRELGGLATISWALVLTSPVSLVTVAWFAFAHGLHASAWAWAAFVYTGVVSIFLALWSWSHGLSLGGIARVGQLQLLQVFFTLGWSHLLLHESVTPRAIATAVVVVAAVAAGRRASAGSALVRGGPA
jgi:drug/metabolite transporter (DMT)-like permease